MPTFLVHIKATGAPVQMSTGANVEAVLAGFGPEFGALPVDDEVSDATHYVKDGKATAFPAKPASWAVFDFATKAWADRRTDADLAAEARRKRDALLLACDPTQLADAPLTKMQQAAWAMYRDALRKLPDQPRFPQQIDWPASP